VHKGSKGLPDPLLGDLGGLLLRLAELRTFHIFSVVNQQQATGRERALVRSRRNRGA
jgi:hypothetical protein